MQQTSGYMCLPTVLDATLHMAAGISRPDQAVLRVPASVGLILCQPVKAGKAYPSASQVASAGDSVTCGFKLRLATRHAAQIADMAAKEMPTAAPLANKEQATDFLYETEMQACQCSGQCSAAHSPPLVLLDHRSALGGGKAHRRTADAPDMLTAPLKAGLDAKTAANLDPCIASTR